ncbi:hypothetical protein [Roseimicrobium sp. ORNL1]|uniref:hypothetical protein n=1 Tax=Roseimicrobium sp. ORNL1 TaxID=2711231 RepID=UPI0013E1738C|nr:hypothetical protein [Roseimicrobium sp. ORNL1]QIF01646.1 hypothetical protein G5S37_08960 [Roseimicrobium sp. ORNL1]
MKAKLLLLVLVRAFGTLASLAAEPAPARFESLKTTDGKEYRDVVVLRALPLSIEVKHAGGEATMIPLRLCPPEVQTAFGYDPAAQAHAKAEGARAAINVQRKQVSRERARQMGRQMEAQKKAQEKAAEDAKEADKIYFLAEVAEVLEKGVVLKEVEYAKAGEKPVAMDPEALIYLECQYMGELGRPYYKRGEVHRLSGWPNGQFTYTNKKKAQSFIPAYVWHWSPEHRATMAEVDRQMRGR